MKFKLILTFTAVIIAVTAAYFSVFGLSKLFAGATLAIILMAGSLEIGKLVAATFLKKYWGSINKGLKAYMVAAVIILMTITSAGIYGFLSNAYQQTSSAAEVANKTAAIFESKKSMYLSEIQICNKQIENSTNRIKTLSDIRIKQENRLDKQYDANTYGVAKRIENTIGNADKSIEQLYSEIKILNNKISVLNDSITGWDLKIIDIKNNTNIADLGPLLYLSKLTGQAMDKIVNWFILLFIIVFDPLAIVLIISINHATTIEVVQQKKFAKKEEKTNVSPVDAVFNKYKKKSRYKPKAQRLKEQAEKEIAAKADTINVPGSQQVIS